MSVENYVKYLTSIEDKGLLSALRTLGTANKHWRATALISNFCKYEKSMPYYKVIAFSIACGVCDTTEGNLGTSVRNLEKKRGNDLDFNSSFPLRAILKCRNANQVVSQYKRFVRQFATLGIPVNHERLLKDITWFHKSGKSIKNYWAINFHGGYDENL